MDAETLQTQMSKVVASLREQLAQARAHVGSTVTDSATRGAIQGALAADDKRITDLDVRLRYDVLEGRLYAERWHAIAQLTSEDIAAQSGYGATSAYSLSRFYEDVVAQSGRDIASGAQQALEAVDSRLPFYLVMVVIGLIAIAVIRVGRPSAG